MKQFGGGVLKGKRKIVSAILSVLCAAVLFCGFFAVKNTSQTQSADALNTSTINSATKIGGGEDLWDSATGAFNVTVANDLSLKLFNYGDAVDYIKEHADAQEKTWTNSTVVPASVLNATIEDTAKQKYGYVVKLGGLDWMIASLTLGGYDSETKKEGEIPVLTLYLADDLTNEANQVITTPFCARGTAASIYSSSPIRKNILSGTGSYSKLALFTDTTEGSFATRYLMQPKSIAYQHTETMVGRQSGTYNHPNDALDKLTTGWATGWGYTVASFYPETEYNGTSYGGFQARYDAWGEDYIWLPSASEVGFSDYANATCIWKLTNEQRSRTLNHYTWLRSGDKTTYVDAGTSLTGANTWYDNWISDSNCVRPAIHLDLTEVLGLMEPEDTDSYTYNGAEQDVRSEKWYNISVFDNQDYCTVKYTNAAGNEVVPKAAGTYTFTATLKEGVNYFWSGDRSNRTRSAKFTIKPKELKVGFEMGDDGYPHAEFVTNYEPCEGETVKIDLSYSKRDGTKLPSPPVHRGLYTVTATITDKNYSLIGTTSYDFELLARRVDVPEFFDGKNSATYATVASGKYQFELDLDSSVFELSVPQEFQKSLSEGGILLDEDNIITVTQAGEYRITVSIKDETGDTLWRDSDDHSPRDVAFTLNPATYSLDFASSTTIMVGVQQNTTVTVYASAPWQDDEILVTLKSKRGNSTRTLASKIKFSSANQEGVYPIELNTSILSEGEYVLVAEGDNRNYNVVLPSDGVSLVVSLEAATASVTWDLRNSKTQIARLTATTETAAFTNKIPYDGQVYYVNATPSLGFTINRSYNEGEFKNGVKTVNEAGETVESTKNAGVYTTTVCIKATATGETHFYSVTYEIVKAKINLGEVKWQNEGKMPYTGKPQTCELIGLPEGVSANYAGAVTGTDAKVIGRISVTLILSAQAEQNYYAPDEYDPDSYEDTEGAFRWSIEWEIVPLTIPLNWKIEGMRDENGALYNGYVLKNGGQFIKYYYYETDTSGNIIDENSPLEEIVVPKDKIKYYKAKATIAENYAQNYKLAEEGEKCYSNFFEVGRVVAEVQVAASKTDGEYIYWGSPVEFHFRVIKGAIDTSYFDVTYFNGYTQLAGAPTNVGSYSATVSLKSTYRNSYSLQGETSFEFKIIRAEIVIKWNESAKPPVLTLNTAEAKAIEYEYVDANNNPILLSGLQRGNEYGVRAVIKDTLNFVFEGNQTATEWLRFSIAATDTIIDPSNPNNPFYPSEKPSDPNVGDNTDKTRITVELASDTAQYTGGNLPVTVICGELPGDAFIIRYYTQDGQEVLSPSAVGVYRVVVSLSGAYSADYVIDGTTSFVYTITGGNGGDTPNLNPGDGTGNNPSNGTIVSYVPVILSGVSAVLIVVFLIMSLNNLSAAKAAREKTKKLAAMSYSFAPISLLGIVLGLSETNWWIIAGILMGLALIMAIFAFMTKGKKKRALEALEEEKERIAEEKEFAKEEKQRAEMRMMFAAMQQNVQQPQMNYGDMQNMIASAVSSLLPAMQQQMALPPAQDPNTYAPQPDYAARAENEELRAQLAKQQELLNQVLQNQQAQQAYDYEEEPEDDISWLGENDEVISLEESYGALSDEGKRAYYEIGSYIMNKPRTSQNDGRYAVLFKYRGRTVFKLAIKDDAPVLYYPTGSRRSEVRVCDAASLEVAKSMIDRTVMRVDSELN